MGPLEDDLDAVRFIPRHSFEFIERYLHQILRWNAEIGLVSKKDPAATCRRLLLESAEFGDVIARALEPDRTAAIRVADVGSGAGFPGLVWQSIYRGWSFVLIERREKKAAFLQRIARELGSSRVEVFAGDARDASRLERFRGAFDVVATMAVGEPGRTAAQIEGLLAVGGVFATTLADSVDVPERCGRSLVLEGDVRANFGRYARYRNRV